MNLEDVLGEFSNLDSSDRLSNLFNIGLECKPGWYPLIYQLLNELNQIMIEKDNHLTVEKVGEKLGYLVFEVDSTDEEIKLKIHEFQEKSCSICEICGNPGALSIEKNILVTRCEKHS